MKKQNLKFIGFVGVILFVVFIFLQKFITQKTQAAWFDDAFAYRNAVPLTKTVADQTDVYVDITVDTSASGLFQADCGDLRWTDQNGTPLKYYIDGACPSATASIHVLLPSFPQGTRTIYYYYGSPYAANGFQSANFSTVATNYSVGTIGSQEKTEGPIDYWRMDEGSGTGLNDSGLNRNLLTLNAQVNNPTWQTEDLCIFGKCLYFEGSNATASAVATTIANIQSVSFWVKPASSSGTIPFVSFSNGTGTIAVTSSNLTLSAPGLTSPTYYVNGNASTTLSANSWNHVVVTSGTAWTGTNMVLGKNQTVYFKGFMDEVKLYNYALTSTQVKNHYSARGSSKGVSLTTAVNPNIVGPISNGLVGYWKMDESATPSIDFSGNGNNGTWSTVAVGMGKFGNAAYYDNAADYINMGNPAILNNLQNWTYSAWLYPTNLSPGYDARIFCKGNTCDSTGDKGFSMFDGGTIGGYQQVSGTDPFSQTSTALTVNTWTFVTVVYNQTTNNIRIFFNGVEQAYTTQTVGASTSLADDSSYNQVVGNRSTTGNTRGFPGYFDEARIYNRVLTPQEVSQLYNWAPGPVGYWKMDEGSGNLADSSSFGTTLTNNNSIPFTPGKYGKGANFTPASNHYFSASSNSTLQITRDMTLSAWIKPSAVTASTQFDIVGKWENSNTSYLLAQYGDEIRFYFNSTSNYVVTTATNLVVGNWYHVEATYNAAGQSASIYVNGVKQATSTTGTIPTSINSNAGSFYIGADISASSGTYEQEITDGTNDTFRSSMSAGYFSNSDGYVSVGDDGSDWYHTSMRFTGVSGISGTTISNAYFRIYCTAASVGTPTTLIYADASASPTAPTSTTTFDNKTMTTAYVSWNPTSCTRWAYNNSPDISSVIQELANSYDSSAIQIFWKNTGTPAGYDMYEHEHWDAGDTVGPILHFEYSGTAVNNKYNGVIDDVKVYNYGRTQKQIVEDMNVGHPFGGSPVGSQVGYWKFDENNGLTANDSGPNNLNATLADVYGWSRDGKYGSAINMTTGNANFVQVSDNNALDLTGNLSLTAWIRPSAATGSTRYTIAGKGTVYLLEQYGDEIRMYIGSESNYVTTNAVNLLTNNWYYVAGVYDSAAQTVKIYVNGQEKTVTTTGTIPSSISTDTTNFFIGGKGSSSQITTDTDDGTELPDLSTWATNNTSGSTFGSHSTYGTMHVGLRFSSIVVPQGATISSATMQLYALGPVGSGWQTRIRGNLSTDASAFSSPSDLPSNQANTTAYVDWNPTSWPINWVTTPTVTTIAQEIVNQGGWASGNHMRFAVLNNGTTGNNYLTITDVAQSLAAYTAKLNITYSQFNGLIDEVKLYSGALTTSQILVDYNRGSTIVFGNTGNASQSASTAYCVPGDASTCTSPVAEWKFEGGFGTTVNDTGGNNYNGSMYRASWTTGKFGKAFNVATNLNGSGNPQGVSLGDNLDFAAGESFTIEAWFKTIQARSDPQQILVKSDSTTYYNLYVRITNGTLCADINDSSTSTSTCSAAAVDDNIWHHAVFSVNRSNPSRLFLDGKEVNSTSSTPTGNLSNTANLAIGGLSLNLAAQVFKGSIDEVKIFNYARTPAQIAWDYNRGAPVGYWKLNECQGSTTNDSSGNGYSGTLNLGASGQTSAGTCTTNANTAWYNGRNGKFNSSLNFDGTDDYISIPDNSVFSFGDSTTDRPFSVSAWVKMTDATSFPIIAKLPTTLSGTGEEWALFTYDDDNLILEVADNSPGNFKIMGLIDSTIMTSHQDSWTHVVATYDGTNGTSGMKLYINGVLQATEGYIEGSYTAMHNTNSPVTIGGYYTSDGSYQQFANGQIDDVKIWNYPLTAAQVRTDYNQGSAVRFGPLTGSP